MNIFIAGGGRVGFHLARLLSIEKHDVTVIEQDRNTVELLDYSLDVSSVHGSITSVFLLQETGVANADLFVSVTGHDELNLIAAASAKGLGAKQVVARVDNLSYVESHILYESVLGIDYILSPDALTALEIAKYIENPGFLQVEELGRGLVQLRQMRVTKRGAHEGTPLKEMQIPAGVLLGLVNRGNKISIPHGDSTIEPGDLVTFIGKAEQMDLVQEQFHGVDPALENVFIMGGASIGSHLAQILEHREQPPKLFDLDIKRCKDLSETLKTTRVVCRDATTRAALDQENVAECDAFVATTADDERNIMACVLAKELGARRTISVVHHPDFASLVGKLGIDHTITPRASVANRVLKLVHQKQKEMSASVVLEEGQVEILEFTVNGNAPVSGKMLKETKFPRGALVATIVRGKNVFVPRGDSFIQSGDSVVVIVTPDCLEAVQKLFQE